MAKHTSSTIDLTLVVSRDPEIHSGDLVFAGTRVPVDNLIDYLKSGHTLEQFIAAFPTVERWQVEAFLDLSPDAIEQLRRHGPRSG
jgi:uncharacterized protein (DUF433 family)